MPIILYAYYALTWVLEPFADIILKARLKKGKERSERVNERKGFSANPRPETRLIWMHGASVGETSMLLSLFEKLKAQHPEIRAVITSQTLTSADMVSRKAPPEVMHQMAPIDGPRAVNRFLDHWKPDAIILAEGEIWPNLIRHAHKRQIPLSLVNARMTQKSLKGWARYKSSAKTLFSRFAFIGAADTLTSDGLCDLIGKEIKTVGNLKRAISAPTCSQDELLEWRNALSSHPCFLAASTHPGEEEFVLTAFSALKMQNEIYANAKLILVPRHPERAEDVVIIIKKTNLTYKKRSEDKTVGCEADVLLADTIGEMGLWLQLASSVYLGGAQFDGVGGHNPIEPLKLRKPFFTGPYAYNFEDLMSLLQPFEAVEIGITPQELAQFWASYNEIAPENNLTNLDWQFVDTIFSAVDTSLNDTLSAISANLKE